METLGMASELGSRFDLDKSPSIGLVPLIVDSRDPEETLAAYASLYLKGENQSEGIVRNISSFARFLETMSFSHGEVLNLGHVARDAQVERKTA